MATPAQLLANRENALASTGPVTPEGKSIASQNRLTTGLFTAHDHVRPEEQTEHNDLTAALQSELSPVGTIEQTYSTEILSATWRLRRCHKIESTSAATEDDRKSIDRARATAHNILRRSIAELRRLQTERQIRNELYPEGTDLSHLGLSGTKEIFAAHITFDRARLLGERVGELNEFASLLHKVTGPAKTQSASNCKTPGEVPVPAANVANTVEIPTPSPVPIARNAACPCGSGDKYKRCCGRNAPAVLGRAA